MAESKEFVRLSELTFLYELERDFSTTLGQRDLRWCFSLGLILLVKRTRISPTQFPLEKPLALFVSTD